MSDVNFSDLAFPPLPVSKRAEQNSLTFIAVVLAAPAAPRHLAGVGGAVRVSTRSPRVLVETFLALPIALAVLAIRALARGAAGLVPQAGRSEVSSEGTRERRLPRLVHGEFLFGGLGRRRGSVATAPVVLVI